MTFKVSFALVNDATMKSLNEGFRGAEGSTDVLSFRLDESEEDGVSLLGEVVVNEEKAAEQANALGHSFEEEVGELVKHGVLHLLGKHHEGDE